MHKYKVSLKNGAVVEAENRWLDLSTIFGILVDHQPFVQIGEVVFAKDSIATIQEIKEEKLETAEKEN